MSSVQYTSAPLQQRLVIESDNQNFAPILLQVPSSIVGVGARARLRAAPGAVPGAPPRRRQEEAVRATGWACKGQPGARGAGQDTASPGMAGFSSKAQQSILVRRENEHIII